MRLLICAGGTGGGVYPALAVLDALQGKVDPVLWVGSETGMEADLISRTRLSYRAIPAAGVHGVGVRTLPGNLLQLARGYLASKNILRDFDPDVLLFTGGYVAVPMALAARKYPSVLFVPDIEPGLALKTLARFSSHIAITTAETRGYLPKSLKTTVTGYPTRPELSGMDKTAARRQFRLDIIDPTLLVFGGSKGSRNINNAILGCIEQLLALTQVIHVTGQADWEMVNLAVKTLPKDVRSRYHPYPYLHQEMAAALACADLAVCRAGASTLGELPLFGLPAVLVPYPYAWRYQKVNAEYLMGHGAGVIVEDARMANDLFPTIKMILNDPKRLAGMKAAMHSLSVKDAAERIARVVLETAEKRNRD